MSATGAHPHHLRIAHVLHEADRAWRQEQGETGIPAWSRLPRPTRLAHARAVGHHLAGHVSSPLASAEDPKRALLAAAVARTLGCGKELWDLKTLTDPAASQVNLTPQPATIAELIAFTPPPDAMERPRYNEEHSTYQLTGTITLAKPEQDSDVHMVIDDGQGHTMILEAVCPGCATGSRVLDQITQVRQAVQAQFPEVAQGQAVHGVSVPVTVTGVLLYDRLHGQSGVAPNGAELHPLLSFQVQGSTP